MTLKECLKAGEGHFEHLFFLVRMPLTLCSGLEQYLAERYCVTFGIWHEPSVCRLSVRDVGARYLAADGRTFRLFLTV